MTRVGRRRTDVMCEHDGCERPGRACRLPFDDEPTEWLCSTHAIEAGYCAACGSFWAGMAAFDFGSGLCDHCRDHERWCRDEDEADRE